ncbi:hypothetical protein RUM44_013733 [Polyplax serrata]|uniref:Uncharacterized protein n=1 Tax=Polyplax serrata TaxID=468196 RepID=A0ABR1BH69_POLSC
MAGHGFWTIVLLVFLANRIDSQDFSTLQSPRCRAPAMATERIEKVISTCQEEIKLALLKEALKILKETTQDVIQNSTRNRSKRELFNEEEQRIAGCLLQCVYKKVNAVDENGYPTVEGLVKLYAEGITDRGYFLATAQAVQQCLYVGYQQTLLSIKAGRGAGQKCDLAYKVFDCVSDQLARYCSGT